MTPKATDQGAARSSAATTSTTASTRKPWKKKTPVEVVLDQINKVREDVTEREEELKQARKQLQKLEEARKLLEST
jgi:predicted patatin/cPLA2 family phospholipase